MKAIEVDIKKIKNLFNPLSDKFSPAIEVSEIDQMMNDGTVFDFLDNKNNSDVDETLSRRQFVAQIAYYLANPLSINDEVQPVVINVGYPEKGDIATTSDEAWLAASLILAQKENRKTLNILFSGSEPAIQAFFKIKEPMAQTLNEHASEIEKLNARDKKNDLLTHFEWHDLGEVVGNPWLDKKYFIEQMKENGITLNMINQTPGEFWEDEDVIKMIPFHGSRNSIVTLPPYVLLNAKVIDAMLDQAGLFKGIWQDYYSHFFEEDDEYSSVQFVTSPVTPEGYVSPVVREDKKYDWRITLEQKEQLIECLKENNNLSRMIDQKEAAHILLKLGMLPETTTTQNLKKVVDMENWKEAYVPSSLYHIMPHSFFENDENSLYAIKSLRYDRRLDKKLNFIWKNWIKDENKFIEYLPQLRGKNFDFYEDLPKGWDKKEPVVMAMLSYTPGKYADLPEKMQLNLNVIKHYIHQGGHDNLDKKALEVLDASQDHDTIKQLIRSRSSLLESYNSETPAHWRKNIDYLKVAADRLPSIKKTKEIINILSEPENALEIVNNNRNNYHWLNPGAQKNLEVIKSYIVFDQMNSYDWSKIPKSVFMSEKNCLEMMKIRAEVCDFIPSGMWKKPQFLLGVLDNLDKHWNLARDDIFSYMPKEVNQFFDTNVVEKGSYRNTLEKYLNSWQMSEKITHDLSLNDEQEDDSEHEHYSGSKMKI